MLSIEHRIQAAPSYSEGEECFIDCLGDMVPARAVKVIKPGCGFLAGHGMVLVEVKKTMAGFRAGERVSYTARTVVPKKHAVQRSGGMVRINTNYRWE